MFGYLLRLLLYQQIISVTGFQIFVFFQLHLYLDVIFLIFIYFFIFW